MASVILSGQRRERAGTDFQRNVQTMCNRLGVENPLADLDLGVFGKLESVEQRVAFMASTVEALAGLSTLMLAMLDAKPQRATKQTQPES
jgi:hypothetical protein